MATTEETKTLNFGCEKFGRLTHVLLHRPGAALELIDGSNCDEWLFDDAPDVGGFIEEHDRYREMLESHGVTVLELSDFLEEHREEIHQLPNLTYLHDTAVISSHGAILSAMATPARSGEETVVGEALRNLGVPVLTRFGPDDAFEGCLLLSPGTLLVAETERHRWESISSFIPRALQLFEEVIYVRIPKARRYMHPDTIYNRVDHGLALAYLPAFQSTYSYTRSEVEKIDFRQHMAEKGVEIVPVSDSEQRRLACSFVPLEPGRILHYDCALDRDTRRELERRGVEMSLFSPDALRAGGGSLRCLTLRLRREPQE
ncbi:MAG: arginine deiminase family protein [Planctomycetota bacterium]